MPDINDTIENMTDAAGSQDTSVTQGASVVQDAYVTNNPYTDQNNYSGQSTYDRGTGQNSFMDQMQSTPDNEASYDLNHIQNTPRANMSSYDLYSGRDNPYLNQTYTAPYPGPAVPEKNNVLKMIIIITVSIILVAGMAVGSWLLFFKKGKSSSKEKGRTPEELAEAFMEAFEKLDVDTMISLYPEELQHYEQVEEIREFFESYADYGYMIRFYDPTYQEGKTYNDDMIFELTDNFEADGIYIADKISDVKAIDVQCKAEIQFGGNSSAQDFSIEVIVAKMDGEWKIINID